MFSCYASLLVALFFFCLPQSALAEVQNLAVLLPPTDVYVHYADGYLRGPGASIDLHDLTFTALSESFAFDDDDNQEQDDDDDDDDDEQVMQDDDAIDVDDDRHVDIDMTLTAPGCPVAGEMPGWVEDAVSTVQGVKDVKVELVFDPPWDISRMSDEAKIVLNMW